MFDEEFCDMDGVKLEIGDTVVFTENCLYVPELFRGVVYSISKSEIVISTDKGFKTIQDDRQLLYLFS